MAKAKYSDKDYIEQLERDLTVVEKARARLDRYVEWNQLTRHQVIVAHLHLLEATSENEKRLADAFGIASWRGTSDLIDQVIAKTQQK